MVKKRTNGEGSVSKQMNRSGTHYVYLAQWMDDSGRRRTRRFLSEADAYAHLADAKRQSAAGRAISGQPTAVADFYEHWVAEVLPHATSRRGKPLAARSRQLYEGALKTHVIPVIGHLKIPDVTTADVERVLRQQSRTGLSQSYIEVTYKAMRRLFASAVKHGHIGKHDNPCDGAEIPSGRAAKAKVVPNPEEVRQLLDTKDQRLGALIALLVLAGLRISEALDLRWADVDLEQRVLVVQSGKGGKRRTLSMSARLASSLSTWRTAQAKARLQSHFWDEEGDYVLTSDAGTRWDDSNARKVFNRYAQKIVPGITPHSLRHASATMMLTAGVPIEIASKVLGHTDVRVTSAIYSHLTQEGSREASDAVDRALGF